MDFTVMSEPIITNAPTEEDIKQALFNLRAQNPTLGINKIHALLLTSNPTWIVSEKRTRKILQAAGLIVTPPKKEGEVEVYPSSRIIRTLDVKQWTPKVEVRFFDKKKGKGLVAKERIAEGETVWKEDPFVVAAEWEIFDLQKAGTACAYCTTPLGKPALVTGCPASTSATYCPARFCNRLCLARSAKNHPLLCPAQNPASTPVINFAREVQWMALHALAQCTSRILLTNQLDDAALEADWQIVRGFAELGMEERIKYNIYGQAQPDRLTWKKAHQLFVQAFKEPANPADKKKLAKILKKPLKEEIEKELFEYEAFLRGLGRMSLNLEAHGGLYTLHSHLNHSCAPNISVRHFDQRTALSRITLVAKKDIEVGQELQVSYVDPEAGVSERRYALGSWGFGTCQCERCMEEEKHIKGMDPKALEMVDLEKELKAGLGVM